MTHPTYLQQVTTEASGLAKQFAEFEHHHEQCHDAPYRHECSDCQRHDCGDACECGCTVEHQCRVELCPLLVDDQNNCNDQYWYLYYWYQDRIARLNHILTEILAA